MEAIGTILRPYAPLIAKAAGTVTFIQLLSPVFILNNIRKRGSSVGFPFVPLLGGLVLTVLFLKFGTIIRDDVMIRVNILGFGLNVIYICVYYLYTPPQDKTKVWSQIGLAGLLSGVCMLYCAYEDPKLLEVRFGLLLTGFLVTLVGSPFLQLGTIIRNKSVGHLPFSIIFSGTLVSITWFTYGLAIQNILIVLQNLILGVMGAVQLYLFVIYPPKADDQVKLKKKKEN